MPLLDSALLLLDEPTHHFTLILPDLTEYRMRSVLRLEEDAMLTLKTTV